MATTDEIMQRAQAFLASNDVETRKPSKLEPYLPALQMMKAAGATLALMVKFLAEEQIKISPAGLSAYLRRHAETETTKKSRNATAKRQAATKPRQPMAPARKPTQQEIATTSSASISEGDREKRHSTESGSPTTDLSQFAALAGISQPNDTGPNTPSPVQEEFPQPRSAPNRSSKPAATSDVVTFAQAAAQMQEPVKADQAEAAARSQAGLAVDLSQFAALAGLGFTRGSE